MAADCPARGGVATSAYTYITTAALGAGGGVSTSAPAATVLPTGVRFLGGASVATGLIAPHPPPNLLDDLFAGVVVDMPEEVGAVGGGGEKGNGGGADADEPSPSPPPPPADGDDGDSDDHPAGPPPLPWALPSAHIRSPCVRLHNG